MTYYSIDTQESNGNICLLPGSGCVGIGITNPNPSTNILHISGNTTIDGNINISDSFEVGSMLNVKPNGNTFSTSTTTTSLHSTGSTTISGTNTYITGSTNVTIGSSNVKVVGSTHFSSHVAISGNLNVPLPK